MNTKDDRSQPQPQERPVILATTTNTKEDVVVGQSHRHTVSSTAVNSSASKHRPLVVKRKFASLRNAAGAAAAAPLPKTATQRRLEQLLDEDPAKQAKKRRKAQQRSKDNNDNLSHLRAKATTTHTGWPQQQKHQFLISTPQQPRQQQQQQQQQQYMKRPKNVLAFRGGLASVPTFKAAVHVLPRPGNNSATSNLSNSSGRLRHKKSNKMLTPPGATGTSTSRSSPSLPPLASAAPAPAPAPFVVPTCTTSATKEGGVVMTADDANEPALVTPKARGTTASAMAMERLDRHHLHHHHHDHDAEEMDTRSTPIDRNTGPTVTRTLNTLDAGPILPTAHHKEASPLSSSESTIHCSDDNDKNDNDYDYDHHHDSCRESLPEQVLPERMAIAPKQQEDTVRKPAATRTRTMLLTNTTATTTNTTTTPSLRVGLQLGRKKAPPKPSFSRNQQPTRSLLSATRDKTTTTMTMTTTTTTQEEHSTMTSLGAENKHDKDTKKENEQYKDDDDDDDRVLLPPPPTLADRKQAERQRKDAAPSASSSKTSTTLSTTSISSRTSNTTAGRGGRRSSTTASNVNNDNFVRLNLRNSAGACRGARNSKNKFRGGRNNKSSRYDNYKNQEYGSYYNNNNQKYSNSSSGDQQDDGDGGDNNKNEGGKRFGSSSAFASSTGQVQQAYVSRMTGLDPLDDFLDGIYGDTTTTTTKISNGKDNNDNTRKKNAQIANKKTPATTSQDAAAAAAAVPMCARHQRPCKLIVVKKNHKGNRGRKFYACSMPRGEQCDHFQWAEDTLEAARRTVKDNASHSSFIARQVKAHVDRFRMLTVPELKEEAERRRLNKNGKKSQLLLRLAVWARDEIAKAVPYPDDEKEEIEDQNATKESTSQTGTEEIELKDSDSSSEEGEDEDSSEDDDDSDDDDDDDELEFFDNDDADQDNEENKGEAATKMEEEIRSDEQQSSLRGYLQSLFGHSNFRDGQEWAIQRCLGGKNSLLVAPTGFGKSLCYALPAALMDGVCVVVSPLISLIQDQLRSLPPRIPAATLSGTISASATAAILDDLVRKRIKILFVSPERLTSPSFRRLFYTKWNNETQQQERRFPEISLLCVDEAHCVSQWAHNFRPCFLRFKGLLQLMKPQSILAVTATAGPRVIEDITKTLGLQSEVPSVENSSWKENENILVIDKARDNIDVSCHFVENHEERLEMISKILRPKEAEARSKKCKYAGVLAKGSVIVYVWRQRDTEIVAENLIAAGVTGGVVMYHGGMDASARTRAQSKFMRGKARICVATVAFGMGIDKADVEGIIHLYLSSSPEHYLQEIGRAGRDGRQARAIALPTIEEIPTRHSLVHSNFISKSQIRALLFAMKKIVEDFNCHDGVRSINLAIPVESMVLECDCKVETIETLLSILEQHGGDNPLLHVEGFNYDKATIAMKKRTLEKLAEKEQLAACILRVASCCDPPIGKEKEEDQMETSTFQKTESFQRHFLAYSQGSYSFSVAKCANVMGPSAESRHVFAALRRLQSSSELELALDTTSKGRVILLKLSEEGCAFFNSENLEKRFDDLTDLLYESFCSSMLSGADKVLDINHILDSVCTAGQAADEGPSQLKVGKSPSLVKFQELVTTYFSQGLKEETEKASRRILPQRFFTIRRHELENDLYALIQDMPMLAKPAPDSEHAPVLGDSKFPDYTIAATAKFLHGLDSPRAPAQAFRGHPLFGKWREVQFCYLQEAIGKLVMRPTK